MKERVSTRFGTNEEVVFVCPHGHDLDDTNTNIIAQVAADYLDSHAVINNGWRRAKTVDEIKGEANCNDINHCLSPVVKAEFLDPIMDAVDDVTGTQRFMGLPFALSKGKEVYVFMVHGVGNAVRQKANDPKLDLIVGFGAGNTPHFTCDEWRRDLFIDYCRAQAKWHTYEGAPGGAYSARSKNNLTQAIHRETGQHVLQLEFVYSLRDSDATAKQTGLELGKVVESILKFTSYSRANSKVSPPPQI